MMNPVPQQKAIKNGGFEVWHDGAWNKLTSCRWWSWFSVFPFVHFSLVGGFKHCYVLPSHKCVQTTKQCFWRRCSAVEALQPISRDGSKSIRDGPLLSLVGTVGSQDFCMGCTMCPCFWVPVKVSPAPQNACNACWLGLVQRLSMQSLCWAMNHFFPNRLEVFLVTADSFKTCNGKKAPAHSKTSFSDCVHASAWWCLSLPTNYINCLDSRHFTLGAEEQRTLWPVINL